MEFPGESALVFCETRSQKAIIDSLNQTPIHIFKFSANINPA